MPVVHSQVQRREFGRRLPSHFALRGQLMSNGDIDGDPLGGPQEPATEPLVNGDRPNPYYLLAGVILS
jgi:hypothetical protein